MPVEHVVAATDVEDHVVARHFLPGGDANGQVGVAVDGRGDPAVGDGEQRITKDVEVLQAAAVAAEGRCSCCECGRCLIRCWIR